MLKPFSISLAGYLAFSVCSNCIAAGDITVTGTTATEDLRLMSLGGAAVPAYSTPICHDGNGLIGGCIPQRPAKVARVAISGGDYTSPVGAVNDLANWCGTPSSSNPCLIKVYPGIYDIGTSSVHLDYDYLDLAGSGKHVTTIRGQIFSFNAAAAVVNITASTHVSDISIVNNRNGTNAVAVAVNGASITPELTRVIVTADSGMNGGATAVSIGKSREAAYPTIENAFLYANGESSVNALMVRSGSKVTVSNSRIVADCPTVCNAVNLNQSSLAAHQVDMDAQGSALFMWENSDTATYTATIEDSKLSGRNGHVLIGRFGGDFVISIATSQLNSNFIEIPTDGGILKCVHSYNGDFSPLNTDCALSPP